MPLPPSPIPPEAVYEFSSNLQALVQAQRGAEVATLAAAIIGQMDRPVTLTEVIELRQDIWFSLYADTRQGRYQEWATTKAERLDAIRE